MEDEKIIKSKYVVRGSIEDFPGIFSKLMKASGSVYQAVFASTDFHAYLDEFEDRYHKSLEDVCTEGFVAQALALNVILDRKTGNAIGWGDCGIAISAFGVDYETGGGLKFGWEARPDYDIWASLIENTLTVYCYARHGGTLEKSLVEHGFKLEG